jgi:hypothetical protein
MLEGGIIMQVTLNIQHDVAGIQKNAGGMQVLPARGG